MKNYIVYASDDNYAMIAGVSMKSLFEVNKGIESIEIFILSNNISKENKCKLNAICKEYERKIVFVEVKEYIERFNKSEKNWNIGIYSRLFIGELLPKYIEKVLYLDCDTIILSSLEELFALSFSEDILAYGVCDRYNYNFRDRLNLVQNRQYINSGVLWISLTKWRKKNMDQVFIDFFDKNTALLQFPDQDAINLLLNGNINLLHPKYNQTMYSAVLPYEYAQKISYIGIDECYSHKMYKEAQDNCTIFHFAGDMFNRPWHKNSRQPYHEEFLAYLATTPWRDSELLKRKYAKKKLSALYIFLYEVMLWKFWKNDNYQKFVKYYKLSSEFAKMISLLISSRNRNSIDL